MWANVRVRERHTATFTEVGGRLNVSNATVLFNGCPVIYKSGQSTLVEFQNLKGLRLYMDGILQEYIQNSTPGLQAIDVEATARLDENEEGHSDIKYEVHRELVTE